MAKLYSSLLKCARANILGKKSMKRTILSTAIAATVSISAQASDYPYYFTVGAAHTDNEASVDHFGDHIKHSYTNEISLGYMLKDDIALEGSLVIPSIIQDDSRADVEQFRFGSFYFLSEDSWKPYLTAAVGLEDVSFGGGSVSNALLSIGAGMQYDSSERLFGRAEIRYDDMVNEYPEHTNYVLEVGYRFGAPAAAMAAATAAAANNMTDKEQLITPEETEIVVAEDKVDEVKQLPATAAGITPVAVAKDADKDGVADSADQCASTPAGTTVDAKGCSEFEEYLKYVALQFNSESATLDMASSEKLNKIAENAKKYPNSKLIITGHADAVGTPEFNNYISNSRAKAARDYLVAKGVKRDIISIESYGETKPVASNDTSEGRAKNRRVEFTLK